MVLFATTFAIEAVFYVKESFDFTWKSPEEINLVTVRDFYLFQFKTNKFVKASVFENKNIWCLLYFLVNQSFLNIIKDYGKLKFNFRWNVSILLLME